MTDVLRILEKVPAGVRLVKTGMRAAQGDPEALGRVLSGEVIVDAANLVLPGAGDVGRKAFDEIRGLATGNIIEGEFRIAEPPPWWDFRRHLVAEKYGAHLIFGPIGSGKTTLAFRLAEVWWLKTGYTVEVVNAYPEDIPPWAKAISMKTLLSRARKVGRYLDLQSEDDEPEVIDPKKGQVKEEPVTKHDLDRFSRRIIVIDEASLSMGSLGTVGKNAARDAAMVVAMHCRHLDTLVVYIGQLMRQVRDDLRSNSIIFMKQPSGEEIWADKADDSRIKYLWHQATDGFAHVRDDRYWYGRYPDLRSWAFVTAPALGGHGYTGLMPFSPPGAEVAA